MTHSSEQPPQPGQSVPPPAFDPAAFSARIRDSIAQQSGPRYRAATADEVRAHNASQASTAQVGEGATPTPAAASQPPAAESAARRGRGRSKKDKNGATPNAVALPVGAPGSSFNLNLNTTQKSGTRAGATLLTGLILVGGGTVYGVEAHQKHWWPFDPNKPTAAVGPAVAGTTSSSKPVLTTQASHSATPEALASSLVPTPSNSPSESPVSSGTPSCPVPNTSLAFTPTSIPVRPMVNGNINNLQIPLIINYKRPGQTVVHKLTGAFGIKVNGGFSIGVGALAPSDSKYPAIMYDQAATVEYGSATAKIIGGYLTTKLVFGNTTAAVQTPPEASTDPVKQGAALSKFFATRFSPALTLPPAEALTLEQSIIGNPNATTLAAKQGLKPEFVKAAAAVVTSTLQVRYSPQLAALYRQGVSPLVEKEEQDACIPKASIASVANNKNNDFTKIPNMQVQYPMPKANSLYTVDTAHVATTNGSPAVGATPAVPATIELGLAKAGN